MIKVKFVKTNNLKLSSLWFADVIVRNIFINKSWRCFYGFSSRVKVFYKKS